MKPLANTKQLALVSVLLGLISGNASSIDLTDMVLVNDGQRAFYIDIFEVTCADAGRVNGSCPFASSGNNWKPARVETFAQAADYCSRSGKRIPTQAEWMAAASNVGQNQHYTLLGDEIQQGNRILARVRQRGSERPQNFAALGIDAIGTVGMTGNRNEWVDNAGRPNQCGRRYETQDLDLLQLNRLCLSRGSLRENAGIRCVVDYRSDVNVTFSNHVTGDLLTHIRSIPQTVGSGHGSPEMETDMGSRRFMLIQEEPYAGRSDRDDSLLERPTPNFDDDY